MQKHEPRFGYTELLTPACCYLCLAGAWAASGKKLSVNLLALWSVARPRNGREGGWRRSMLGSLSLSLSGPGLVLVWICAVVCRAVSRSRRVCGLWSVASVRDILTGQSPNMQTKVDCCEEEKQTRLTWMAQAPGTYMTGEAAAQQQGEGRSPCSAGEIRPAPCLRLEYRAQ